MSPDTLTALCVTAAVIGTMHTLLGPDHYVPFIAMSRVREWPLPKTIAITMMCGLGHVIGSIALGSLGIAVGLAVGGMEAVEAIRGSIAGWLLLGFGLCYLAWGVRRAYKPRPHAHWHEHEDGTVHRHEHQHDADHSLPRFDAPRHRHTHAHDSPASEKSITPWVLFAIFAFGPCEPLIPLLMYPAAELSWFGVATVTAVFALATIGTMTTIVVLTVVGLARVSVPWLTRWSHATAGAALAACGIAIKLGL